MHECSLSVKGNTHSLVVPCPPGYTRHEVPSSRHKCSISSHMSNSHGLHNWALMHPSCPAAHGAQPQPGDPGENRIRQRGSDAPVRRAEAGARRGLVFSNQLQGGHLSLPKTDDVTHLPQFDPVHHLPRAGQATQSPVQANKAYRVQLCASSGRSQSGTGLGSTSQKACFLRGEVLTLLPGAWQPSLPWSSWKKLQDSAQEKQWFFFSLWLCRSSVFFQ